ncbi:MAG: M56 family metallopeptidase [Alistipes sp.]|nr:M56 family metallopeptidase [Alistipes sp.]
MFEFLVYLGQSALCLAALYLIYKVAMSHETLHILNRVVLLGSIILSALLPLCRVKIVKEYDVLPTVKTIEVDDMVVVENVPELGIDFVSLFKDIAVALFALGFLFMLLRLLVSIYSVWRLVHSGRMSVIEEDVTLTVVSKLSTPFSWFGHIVASEEDMREYRDMILSHELAHIRLRHSWDVLFADLALCLWWFNPAMWLLRRELQSLHEYQADEAVINNGVNAKNYQMLLIKRAAGARLHSVANCLNHSNLKNRITMMCKKTSSRWAATKALLVLPVVAVSLSAFATTVYVPREVQNKITENFANEQIEEKTNPIIAVGGEIIPNGDLSSIPHDDVWQINKTHNYADLPKELKEVLTEEEVTQRGVVFADLAKDRPNVIVVDEKVMPFDKVGLSNYVNPDDIHSKTTIRESGQIPSELNLTKEQAEKGVHIIETKQYVESKNASSTQQQQDLPFIKVEKMPTFQGGDLNAYRNWVQSQIQYPAEAAAKNISGRVIFSFVVEKDGSSSDFTIMASPDKSLSAEVERVFKTSPKWEAGVQMGKKVRVKYTVPIVFNMQGAEEKKTELVVANEILAINNSEPYIKVEKMPTFQGGDLNAYRNWVQSQIQYPAEAATKNISGRVIFSFVVEKDGSSSDFTIMASPDKSLSAEVERVFKTSPKWEAGTQRGEKVRVKYTVPILFKMQGGADDGLKIVKTESQPITPESIAATEEFKKSADIVIKVDGDKETYIVNGKEVKKEEVGAYEPEKVVVEGALTDGVKFIYIKKK